jgi:hypothetical protein
MGGEGINSIRAFLVLYLGLLFFGTMYAPVGLDLWSPFTVALPYVGNIGPAFGAGGAYGQRPRARDVDAVLMGPGERRACRLPFDRAACEAVYAMGGRCVGETSPHLHPGCG